MSDKPSLSKNTSASTSPAAPTVQPPRFILIAAGALVLSGVMALLAALSLLTSTVKSWVRDNARDSFSDDMLNKLEDARKAGPSSGTRGTQLDQLKSQLDDLKQTAGDRLNSKLQPIYDSVDQLKTGAKGKGPGLFDDIRNRLDDVKNISEQITAAQKGTLISSVIVFIALAVAAGAVYKGRHWSRWAVIGLWVLATFTQTVAGISSVLTVASDIPLLFKLPAFLSGLSLLIAVVLVNLRPSVDFLNRSRPVRPAGAAPRRGLFSPQPRTPATTPAARTSSTGSTPERARTKQRTNGGAAAAKGAELARQRAKAANKSRRSGN